MTFVFVSVCNNYWCTSGVVSGKRPGCRGREFRFKAIVVILLIWFGCFFNIAVSRSFFFFFYYYYFCSGSQTWTSCATRRKRMNYLPRLTFRFYLFSIIPLLSCYRTWTASRITYNVYHICVLIPQHKIVI